MELVYYFLVAAERVQAKTRFFFVTQDNPALITREDLFHGNVWKYQPLPNTVRMIDTIPLQAGSNNIVISDLLFPGNPDIMCAGLTRTPSTSLLFVPYLNTEACPNWTGSMEFDDCEQQYRKRQVRCDRNFLVKYRDAYMAHFSQWENTALRCGIPLRRTCAEEELSRQIIFSIPHHQYGSTLP